MENGESSSTKGSEHPHNNDISKLEPSRAFAGIGHSGCSRATSLPLPDRASDVVAGGTIVPNNELCF
jgi:hypothetical protein